MTFTRDLLANLQVEVAELVGGQRRIEGAWVPVICQSLTGSASHLPVFDWRGLMFLPFRIRVQMRSISPRARLMNGRAGVPGMAIGDIPLINGRLLHT